MAEQEDKTTIELCAEVCERIDQEMAVMETAAKILAGGDEKFKGTAFDPKSIGNKPYWNSKEDDMTDNQEAAIHVGSPGIAEHVLGNGNQLGNQARRIVMEKYISVEEQLRLIETMAKAIVTIAERKKREKAIAQLSELSQELGVIIQIDIENTNLEALESVAKALYKLKMITLEHGGELD